MKKQCVKVFKNFKKVSRKFKKNDFNKKLGLYKFNKKVCNLGSSKNRKLYKAFLDVSKKVKPYNKT